MLRIGLSALYIAIQSYFIYDAIVIQKSPFWAILWSLGILLVMYDFYDKQIKKKDNTNNNHRNKK